MDWSFLIAQATVNGLITGLLYLLMAIGFTLVFGVMRIVNFAHGEFYMLGAFSAYFLTTAFEVSFLPALAITFAGAVIFGAALEWLILKPFRHDELNGMIATIGLATRPTMLLLDEPAAGLNHEECNDLTRLLRRLRDEHGLTLLLVEHHMALVMELCERIVVLVQGEKIAEGTPEAIGQNPAVIEAYLGAPDYAHA